MCVEHSLYIPTSNAADLLLLIKTKNTSGKESIIVQGNCRSDLTSVVD